MTTNQDLKKLITNLPIFIHDQLHHHPLQDELLEIILDLGKRPEARFSKGPEYLAQKIISWQDLEYTIKRVSKFTNENRAGVERTLHRISCFRNRQFLINGLTCRIGRSIFGTISIIRDLLTSQKSILILGKPGVGKTTIIREIARVLADEMDKRVIIVDTSNEIAGDSDIPHLGIGRSRRLQVTQTKFQHQTMIEAVENHMPQVIIIDEIATELEVLAAQTIAEKGVQLVGTTHGHCLENLIKNPILAHLIGGIQYVTLSDEEAKRRGTQKSILERKSYPTFELLIELKSQKDWIIHEDMKRSVDFLLLNKVTFKQVRKFKLNQIIQIKCNRFLKSSIFAYPTTQNLEIKSWVYLNLQNPEKKFLSRPKNLVIYTYSISTNLLKEILLKLGIKFTFTTIIKKASIIIGVKKDLRKNLKLNYLAKQKNIPVYSLNKLSFYQLAKLSYFLNQ